MTAHVRKIQTAGTGVWHVTVARDHELSMRPPEPPMTDLPPDIRRALVAWLIATHPTEPEDNP